VPQHSRIVDALSALVLQILDADQQAEFALPVAPLTAGKILMGRENLKIHDAPSQIVMIPVGFMLGPPDTKSNQVKASDGSFPGQQARKLRRPLASKATVYEVHVWGQANPADPERLDFDATDYLADVVLQAAQLLAMGSVSMRESRGIWEDQQEGATQRVKAGHRVSFQLTISAPVLDSSVQFPPAPLTLVPAFPTFATGGD
jgi:hypothetical protein